MFSCFFSYNTLCVFLLLLISIANKYLPTTDMMKLSMNVHSLPEKKCKTGKKCQIVNFVAWHCSLFTLLPQTQVCKCYYSKYGHALGLQGEIQSNIEFSNHRRGMLPPPCLCSSYQNYWVLHTTLWYRSPWLPKTKSSVGPQVLAYYYTFILKHIQH